MTGDIIKIAEKRGYSKGYAAGLRKNGRKPSLSERRDAFYNDAFLAALPACISAQGWTWGGMIVNDAEKRVRLADYLATEALKYFRS